MGLLFLLINPTIPIVPAKGPQEPLPVPQIHMRRQPEAVLRPGAVGAHPTHMPPEMGEHRLGMQAQERPIHGLRMEVRRLLGMHHLEHPIHMGKAIKHQHGTRLRKLQTRTVRVTGALTTGVEHHALVWEGDGAALILIQAGAMLHLRARLRQSLGYVGTMTIGYYFLISGCR